MMANIVVDMPRQNQLMEVFTAINAANDGEISEQDISSALV